MPLGACLADGKRESVKKSSKQRASRSDGIQTSHQSEADSRSQGSRETRVSRGKKGGRDNRSHSHPEAARIGSADTWTGD
jgi:hypothetical protein